MTTLLWLALMAWAAPSADIGLKAGYQYANLQADPLSSTTLWSVAPVSDSGEWRDGFAVGLYSVSHLSDTFGLQVEVMYSRQGCRQERALVVEPDPSSPDQDETRLNLGNLTLSFLDIPLLVRTSPRGWGHHWLTGVVIGVPLSQKISLEEDGVKLETDLEGLDRADVGLVAGVGVSVDWGELELRYSHGLRNLDQRGLARVRPRTWALLTGIRF